MNNEYASGLNLFEEGERPPMTDVHAALASLRSRAERRQYLVTQGTENRSPEEVKRMMQELQVHQIELEMQYEELLLAQTEVQNARAQYVDLYDFAPVGYFTLTATGLIQQLNLCASKLLGTVRQRLMGRRFALFVAPNSRLEFGQFLARVLSTSRTLSCDIMLQREDGTPFHALLEGLRMEESPENVAANPQCRLAVIDTTARHETTAALAASEARFRRLFNDSHDAVLLLQGHTYIDCNTAALRLVGASHRDEIVGRNAWTHTPEVQPDGRRTVEIFRKSVEEAMHTGSKRCECLMHKVTGEEIWIEAVLTPIEDGHGKPPLVHIIWRDVTAERAAVEQLRESEARLSLALDASETGIFTWDLTHNQVVWDERAQAIFGLVHSPQPVPVEVLRERFHPADAARVWEATEVAIATKSPLALDYRVVWPDGSVHYVSTAGRAIANERGKLRGFAGVMRDVTAIYTAEEELHYKSLVMAGVLDNLPVVLARLQPDGTIIERTGAELANPGLSKEATLGRNVLDLFPRYREQIKVILEGGHNDFLATVEGDEQNLHVHIYGFFDQQQQQALLLVFDVTEIEEKKSQLLAEKEFTESLLQNSVDGIVAIDRTGIVTAWNRQATRYFGQEASDVLGQPLFDVLPRLDCDEAKEVVGRVLAGEQVLLAGQPFEHRAGHYDAYHVPLRQQGEITGILIIFRDVTERDRLAEEATQLRLRQQQDVLSAILTTQETERKRIAEALHNGLGQVLYATKLSLEGRGGTPSSPRASLKLLHEAIQTTRTISFELTPGILEDFGLRTALLELSKRITPTGLPVHLHLVNLEERLRPTVEIAVYRIVQELLNNIMKHAQATEVVVHVVREKQRLEVSVEDNGCGFDPNALTTLPLAGMGLSGVRNRVALLGGVLSIDSRLGQGTIVSFSLDE
ncbi:PAS domain S-box protein [Hymenobacter arizonensis]|uniref:histidine kinase n=1 Tax=Hymenobacter arizonensis TaxID=1227077 RepID=A0A1I5Z4W9_HYMAR|nr:PAS domain S-box protein [Hymenobacter arizonensis]SFQ51536.1 PAS domain S-box-containing protein [Hymenobacter arizonensis]